MIITSKIRTRKEYQEVLELQQHLVNGRTLGPFKVTSMNLTKEPTDDPLTKDPYEINYNIEITCILESDLKEQQHILKRQAYNMTPITKEPTYVDRPVTEHERFDRFEGSNTGTSKLVSELEDLATDREEDLKLMGLSEQVGLGRVRTFNKKPVNATGNVSFPYSEWNTLTQLFAKGYNVLIRDLNTKETIEVSKEVINNAQKVHDFFIVPFRKELRRLSKQGESL